MSERRVGRRDRRGRPADDLLSSSVEALAVLLDAGIAPRSAWQYVAAEATHPAVARAAHLVAAGSAPSEALAAAARLRPAPVRDRDASPGGAARHGLAHVRDPWDAFPGGGARYGRTPAGHARAAPPGALAGHGAAAAGYVGDATPEMSARHRPPAGYVGEVTLDVPAEHGPASAPRGRDPASALARHGVFARGHPAARKRTASARHNPAPAADAGVAAVAAAWGVAEYAGASLAPALRGAAEALRDRAEAERDVATALAGPRATARLMSWLPAVGVAMAYGIGVDVIGTLVTGPLGWIAALSGGGLLIAGRSWTRRLIRSASRAGPVAGIQHDLTAIALAGGMSVPAARATIVDVTRRVGIDAVAEGGTSVDRVLRIAERAGAPAVELLAAEARQERRTARADGRRRAELLAVRLLLPLGVCVLPAFVLLGVVPVILAMMSSTIAGLS